MEQGNDDFRLSAQMPRESVDRCIGSRTLEILQRTAEKAHSLTAAISILSICCLCFAER